ncbi:unnamed protein product [Linum trigynum]|uniref:AAA-type ATPase N-terminal domain-containing protein n=1 Tax=Linum trigynum TaxID=586398 RepID=A0AAV2E757_9ROSI
MLVRYVAYSLIPHEVLLPVIFFAFRFLSTRFSKTLTLVVEQNARLVRDELYESDEIYPRTKISPVVRRLKIGKIHKQKKVREQSSSKDWSVIPLWILSRVRQRSLRGRGRSQAWSARRKSPPAVDPPLLQTRREEDRDFKIGMVMF